MKVRLHGEALGTWKTDLYCLLIPLLAFLAATPAGLHHTYDSYLYAEAAANIAAGAGLVLDNQPYINSWGPLYPFLLSMGAPAVTTFAWWLHLLALLGTCWLWLQMGRNMLKRSYILFCLLLLSSTPVLMVHVFLWSEAVFVWLLSLYLFLLLQYIRKGGGTYLLTAALPGLLCFMQRNAALFFLAGIFIALILHVLRLRKKDAPMLLVHMCLVLSGGVAWNLYNYFYLNQQDSMQELGQAVTALTNLPAALKETAASLLPVVSPVLTVAGIVLVVVVLVIAGKITFKTEATSFSMVIYAGFVSYLLVWGIITPAIPEDMGRLLAPSLPFFYLLFGLVLDWLMQYRRVTSTQFTAVVVLLVLYPAVRLLKNVLQWGQWL